MWMNRVRKVVIAKILIECRHRQVCLCAGKVLETE